MRRMTEEKFIEWKKKIADAKSRHECGVCLHWPDHNHDCSPKPNGCGWAPNAELQALIEFVAEIDALREEGRAKAAEIERLKNCAAAWHEVFHGWRNGLTIQTEDGDEESEFVDWIEAMKDCILPYGYKTAPTGEVE